MKKVLKRTAALLAVPAVAIGSGFSSAVVGAQASESVKKGVVAVGIA